jgi:hypothetical protein
MMGQISIAILVFSAIIFMAKNAQIANTLQLFHLGPGECMFATHIKRIHHVYVTTIHSELPASIHAAQTHKTKSKATF